MLHSDGRWCETETVVTSLVDDHDIRGLVLNTRDVSERKELERQLTKQAFSDSLTGLANRALFRNRVESRRRRALGPRRPRRRAVPRPRRLQGGQRRAGARDRRQPADAGRRPAAAVCRRRRHAWLGSAVTSSPILLVGPTGRTERRPRSPDRIREVLRKTRSCSTARERARSRRRPASPSPTSATRRPTRSCATPTWRCTAPRPRTTAATCGSSRDARRTRGARAEPRADLRAGAGPRPARAALPADGEPAHRPGRRRRGVDPLVPPDPRPGAADGVHRPRRGDRTRRIDRRVGACASACRQGARWQTSRRPAASSTWR